MKRKYRMSVHYSIVVESSDMVGALNALYYRLPLDDSMDNLYVGVSDLGPGPEVATRGDIMPEKEEII